MKFKLKIPTDLSEIKLKDYQKYMKMVVENEGAVDFLNLKAVEIFCNVKIKDVKSIKASDFDEVVSVIKNTFEQDNKFKQRFTFDGVEYGFIPNLEDISMGEFVDLQNYLADIQDYHKALAVMYRPITHRSKDMYLIEDYEGSDKYSDVMKYTPLDVVLGANVFFYNLGNVLLKHTLDYLEGEVQTNTQAKQILEENGVGIRAFTQLLEGNSISLKTSLN